MTRKPRMKLLLYKDRTVEADIEGVAALLADMTSVSIELGRSSFEIPRGVKIRRPDTYADLPADLLLEASTADVAVFFTRQAYQNNFFFEYSGSLAIVSLFAWEQLTTLPLDNGLAYFMAKILRGQLPFPRSHRETTGCLNDFLVDKSSIDVGMRSGRICDQCRGVLATANLSRSQVQLRADIEQLLALLSTASRHSRNVLEVWRARKTAKSSTTDGPTFDVFLCHNSQDKKEIRAIAKTLTARGVTAWLDDEQLRPGVPWQVILEQQIGSIRTAAVFVGGSGMGPWQNMEMRAFLSEFVRRECPVIPVILSNADHVPDLPIFLRQLVWVDFRDDRDEAVDRLLWGITGRRVIR